MVESASGVLWATLHPSNDSNVVKWNRVIERISKIPLEESATSPETLRTDGLMGLVELQISPPRSLGLFVRHEKWRNPPCVFQGSQDTSPLLFRNNGIELVLLILRHVKRV